jgi:seryl-tRNA synthetase (EC 6.1.1.11)
MLDLRYLREEREKLERALKNRGYSLDILEELDALDKARREYIKRANELRARKNEISKEIGLRKKAGEDISDLLEEAKRVEEELREVEEKEKEADKKFWELWAYVPNIPHESVPVGKDSNDNVIVRQWGEIREFDFEPKPHWEIGEMLGILDFESASKMSGSRFAVYKGLGAILERALINFFLDTHRKNGYIEVFPPILVKPESLFASGHLPKFEEEMYRMERDDMYLIPTAEVSLANLHRDEVIPEEKLPLYYVAYTPLL